MEQVSQPPGAVVHVVEDDELSRIAAARVLRQAGHAVRLYASADEFLQHLPEGPGCIVLDLQMPGSSGFDLQDRLASAEDGWPIVFVSGHGNVPKTAHAMKSGAVDFLTKPVDVDALLDAVGRALARDAATRRVREQQRDARRRYERLTPREREVFAHVISGQLNKQIAFDLGTTEHTVKVHRHRVMEKLEADSTADLIRLASLLEVAPRGSVR
jgi:FixJ family two-component response regulator